MPNDEPQIVDDGYKIKVVVDGNTVREWTYVSWSVLSMRREAEQYLAGFLAGAAAERERDKWQPIETAPKDGVSFLACVGNWFTVASWNKYRGRWCVSAPGYPNYEPDEEPTHWRHLPERKEPAP